MKVLTVLAGSLIVAVAVAQAADKKPFKIQGLYSETCSCGAPCGCEMVGIERGCEGVGAMQLSGGTYNGKSLAGMKAAYAVKPGDWVILYVQPARPDQADAARAFVTAVFSNWGKVEAVKDAKIDITGKQGDYTVMVDDGKIMKYQTKAVMGADGKTPIAHTNIADPLNQTLLQGLSESATFKDGTHEINLDKGRNAFFNDKMDSKGDI